MTSLRTPEQEGQPEQLAREGKAFGPKGKGRDGPRVYARAPVRPSVHARKGGAACKLRTERAPLQQQDRNVCSRFSSQHRTCYTRKRPKLGTPRHP
jgi:hypothetical protein